MFVNTFFSLDYYTWILSFLANKNHPWELILIGGGAGYHTHITYKQGGSLCSSPALLDSFILDT